MKFHKKDGVGCQLHIANCQLLVSTFHKLKTAYNAYFDKNPIYTTIVLMNVDIFLTDSADLKFTQERGADSEEAVGTVERSRKL